MLLIYCVIVFRKKQVNEVAYFPGLNYSEAGTFCFFRYSIISLKDSGSGTGFEKYKLGDNFRVPNNTAFLLLLTKIFFFKLYT